MTKDEWKEVAYNTVCLVAKRYAEFTPDEIWAAGLPKPEEARALGGVMTRARNAGVIEKTGRVRPTTQPESHNTDVTIWRSMIYKS